MDHFRPGVTAKAAHCALLNSLATMEKAKQHAVLWFGDILDRKLYRELGYSTINQYARQELGFSKTRTGDFLQLCRKLDRLPRVKKELASGGLGYTAARVLVQVADPRNEEAWVAQAKTRSRRALEKQVQQAKRAASDRASGQLVLMPEAESAPAAAVLQRVTLEMSAVQLARFEALWEQVRKQGSAPADKVEILLEALAGYVDKRSPRGDLPAETETGRASAQSPTRQPYQIHIHQCPSCEKGAVPTSRGELPLAPPDLARARCDSAVSRPGKRNTASIAPAVRRAVLSRDRHRCRRSGCRNTRYLEVHHVIPRARGGGNEVENLITLCSGCHGLVHAAPLVDLVRERGPDYCPSRSSNS